MDEYISGEKIEERVGCLGICRYFWTADHVLGISDIVVRMGACIFDHGSDSSGFANSIN